MKKLITFAATIILGVAFAIFNFIAFVIDAVFHPIAAARNAKNFLVLRGSNLINPSGASVKFVVNLFKSQGRHYNWQAGNAA